MDVFSFVVNSSVWEQRSETRIVWVSILSLANREGRVVASLPGLAKHAGITIDECESALSYLSSDDELNPFQDFNGKRIVSTESGWDVLSFEKIKEAISPVPVAKVSVGYVYYVGVPGGDKVKIGFSKNPWARLDALRSGEINLEILATEKGSLSDEKKRHSEFRADKIGREWFKASRSLLSLINQLASSRTNVAAKKRSRPPSTYAEADTDAYTELNIDAWNVYKEHRKEIRAKPLTTRGQKMAMTKLCKLSKRDQMNCVEDTVANGWTGLFPEKVKNGTHKQSNQHGQDLARLRERAGLN